MRRHGWQGTEVLDCAGAFVGRIATTWPLDGGGEPQMVLVRVGRRFARMRYLPLEGARLEDGKLHMPYERWQIDDGPAAEDHRWADPAHLARAYWLSAVAD
jgi:hypothetical protein